MFYSGWVIKFSMTLNFLVMIMKLIYSMVHPPTHSTTQGSLISFPPPVKDRPSTTQVRKCYYLIFSSSSFYEKFYCPFCLFYGVVIEITASVYLQFMFSFLVERIAVSSSLLAQTNTTSLCHAVKNTFSYMGVREHIFRQIGNVSSP